MDFWEYIFVLITVCIDIYLKKMKSFIPTTIFVFTYILFNIDF